MKGDSVVYNRYIPGTDGVYRRIPVSCAQAESASPPKPPEREPPPLPPKPEPEPCCLPGPLQRVLPQNLDTGDLLIGLILLLLLLDGDEQDSPTLLLAAAAFLLFN